jgi:hypothetical protein
MTKFTKKETELIGVIMEKILEASCYNKEMKLYCTDDDLILSHDAKTRSMLLKILYKCASA